MKEGETEERDGERECGRVVGSCSIGRCCFASVIDSRERADGKRSSNAVLAGVA